ncbi:helix-turn-helix domain-containing protein [Candidiatus Paracoxiella cheracis]|uniref:helix-turn-helix domain-containing protein n=1 Tax=Candidiatus Paracoxiella cheracis TaxID=3405120 RepID=UPI003BF5BCBD
MEEQPIVDVTPSVESNMSPGAMLEAAREVKKLSQADVAKALRLSLQWVKDIENDDFTHGAAIIYVRGYLRSYARLLGLSPDSVMNAFDAMDLEEEFKKAKSSEEKIVLQPTVPVFSKQTRFMSRRAVRWISGAIILVLVILVGMWWQGQRKHGLDQTSQVAQPQITIQPVQPLPDIAKPQVEVKKTNSVNRPQLDQQKNKKS